MRQAIEESPQGCCVSSFRLGGCYDRRVVIYLAILDLVIINFLLKLFWFLLERFVILNSFPGVAN